jgi:hypothetical protein
VELLSYGPKKKEKWEMSVEEKMEAAKKGKDVATGLFQVGLCVCVCVCVFLERERTREREN